MKTTPSNRSVSVGRRAQVRHHTVSAEALRFEEVETTQAKTCKACGVKKPVLEFHHQALGKFGVTSKCKPCKNAMTKAWEMKNPEQCREKVRNWRANNREHVRENGRIAYAANRKQHIEKQVAWQKRNPESKRINGSRYRVTHSDKIKRWRRENYGMIYAHNAARRALRLKACPPWITEDQKAEMKAIYEKARELTIKTGVVHHVDHKHPLKNSRLCGLHVPWNLQILTAQENLTKGNRLTSERSQ
jgi:5-methylcytosine-specific restriction endonuclease McrA